MMWAPTGKGGTNHARKLEKEGLSLGLLTVGILILACSSGSESVNQGGSGGSAGSGGSSTTGGSSSAGGSSASGGDTGEGGAADSGGETSAGGSTGGSPGGSSGAGGSAPADAVVCKPTSAVINDFSDGECAYGKWGDGEMNTSAWSYGNSMSSIEATCDSGSWTFSGTVGVTSATGENAAGFGFSLTGYVHDSIAEADVDCTAFDLSAYPGLVISLASASGDIAAVGIGVDLADGDKGEKKIDVPTTAEEVTITWSDLGISDASRVKTIWGYFPNGASDVAVDLVIDKLELAP